MINEELFKTEDIDLDKLCQFGFEFSSGKYLYKKFLLDGQFELCVTIKDGEPVKTDLFDVMTEEPYTLHLVEDAFGAFVGSVRREYKLALQEIYDKCRKTKVFKSVSANEITQYFDETYSANPEFLWEGTPKNAIWRRSDNDKWIAVLLTVKKSKLGLYGEGEIEVLNLRINPIELDRIVDERKYFRAYHMNKRLWVSILLDGSVSLDEIKRRIDDSFALAKKK